MRKSLLNIIDLAGSERRQTSTTTETGVYTLGQLSTSKKSALSKPKYNGKQAPQTVQHQAKPAPASIETEANFINKSLSTLGRIFTMLADRSANKKQAMPYRECKLTRILQDSLNYSSKTLVIVNVCSEFRSVRQSKESLNFAS